MTDREKVIKGLRDLRRYLEDKEWSDSRVDRRVAKVYWQTVTDAIAMLKEQETELCDRCGRRRVKSGRSVNVEA